MIINGWTKETAMYSNRKNLYQELENIRGSKVLCYVTGDRPGLETKIHSEVYDYFVNHLDMIGVVPKISLFLYTRGGDTLAAWSIVNLINLFCSELEVIVPSKAHSAGTLICLGAKRIVMTKQATLGPIDPSITTPLNPGIPGAPPDAKYPVSVEAINGFFEMIREQGIKDSNDLATIVVKLSESVHPLVLGQVYRAKSQIQMLARRLVTKQVSEKDKIEKIISFLCSESGSHDYTIHRREALESLELNIEKPDDCLYRLIKSIYDDIASEFELTTKFDPNTFLGQDMSKQYSLRRCIVESIPGGSYHFCTEGTLRRVQGQQPSPQGPIQVVQIQDNRSYEGWRYTNA